MLLQCEMTVGRASCVVFVVSPALEGTRHSLGSVGGEARMEERGKIGGGLKGGGHTDIGCLTAGV